MSDGPKRADDGAAAAPHERGVALARQALLVTLAVYAGYALLGLLAVPGDLRYLALVGCFYFLPSWVLRRDPERQARWQIGPRSVIPAWHWRGAKVAAVAILAVFPPFVLFFLWFYAQVCPGEPADVFFMRPVLWAEQLTPATGQLDRYFDNLCRPHNGELWPDRIRLPVDWLEYGGAALVFAVAIELFAIAMPEEVFHRGYLMSALQERWAPRRRLFGVPFGLAAVLSSALFAVGHLVGMAEGARLATFFPALLFAWLWRKSDSLWAPALFHAASNLLMAILIASTFPR